MTRLILTGDDFGASHAVNEAVEAQYQAGRLTQASLMIHGVEMEEAKRIALRNPGLCVGLHLTLCAGSREGATALTDALGNFEPSPARAGWRYHWNSALFPAICAEIEEQFARFLAAGFAPIYWDGHTHLHLHPTIFCATLPVARVHGFRAVRLLQRQNPFGVGWVFNRLSASAKSQLGEIRFAERTFGLRETGRVDDRAFDEMQNAARCCDLAEIYYHPGLDGPVLEKRAEWHPTLRLTNWRDVDDAAESR